VYSSTHPLTSLEGVGGQHLALAALSLEQPQYPRDSVDLGTRLDGQGISLLHWGSNPTFSIPKEVAVTNYVIPPALFL
jgi:hypothetical protein